MTLYVTRSIHCDERDCLDGDDFDGLPGQLASTVRKLAIVNGWRRVGGKDYCPLHPAAPDEVALIESLHDEAGQ